MHKWFFPNGCRKNIGINNGNIETFKDTPINSLGREICQNSLDARANEEEPVVIDFKMCDVPADKFPDLEGLKYAIGQGKKFWDKQDNPKADRFFEGAIKTIIKDKISVLRISDHNTVGLDGADDPDNTKAKWTSLVMSEGASSKDGTEGGSFGIGKFAAFANSKIRTVFYSTVDGEGKEASQGICYLASFIDESGSKTFGEGYCGNDSAPIFSQIQIDDEFSRQNDDPGTDIYVCGFSNNTNWKEKMIAAVLDGFMYAIDQEMLVVNVEDVSINKQSLDTIVDTYGKYCSELTIDYYKVLRAETSWIEIADYKETGSLKVKLLISQGLHRRVAMVRKTGMKILDKGNISGQIAFAGIMYIEGEKANKYLVGLENPAHTKWLPERDEENPAKASSYIAGLTKVLKDELNKLIERDFSGEVTPELGNMLQSIQPGDGNSKEQETLSDEPITIETKTKEVLPSSNGLNEVDTEENSESGGDEGGKDHGGNGHSGGGQGYGGGEGGAGERGSGKSGSAEGESKREKKANVILKTNRVVATDVNSGRYKILLKPKKDVENATVEINVSGEDAAYLLQLSAATISGQPDIEVDGGEVRKVQLSKDNATEICIATEFTDYTAFEVKCYEVKSE